MGRAGERRLMATEMTKRFSQSLAAVVLATAVIAPTAQAVLDVEVSEAGKVRLSADGAGSDSGATIFVDKQNVTDSVRSAFLTCSNAFF